MKTHIKNYIDFLNESVAKDLKHYLKNEYDDLKEEYGFYEIKVEEPEKVKKQLLKNFESGIMKIDIDGKKLKIFKNDAKFDCVMFYANIEKKVWSDILEPIDEKDLYEDPEGKEEFGKELDPHCTLIFGKK